MPPSPNRSRSSGAVARRGGKVLPGARPRQSIGNTLGLSQVSRRHRKVVKDTIYCITAPDIRRLARRGGVKRISREIYHCTRTVLRDFLAEVDPSSSMLTVRF